MPNYSQIPAKVEVRACGRSTNLFLKIPQEVGEKYGLKRGDVAFPGINENDESIFLIYEFKRGNANVKEVD